MKDKLGGKIMTHSDQNQIAFSQRTAMKIKKQKINKSLSKKGKLKFEDYKYCREGTQLKDKINKLYWKIKQIWIALDKVIKNS